MADQKPKSVVGPKVSPARTVVSLVLLLVVGVVCVIELRAGLGQMLSGKALSARSNDGEFKDLTFEEARGLLSMGPSESVENRGPDTAYRYEWFSLLRPLMNQKNPRITILASHDEKPMALAFHTVLEDEMSAEPLPPAESSPPPGTAGLKAGGMGPGSMGMGPSDGSGGRKGKRPDVEGEEVSPGTPGETATEAPAPASTETPASTEAPAPAPANP